MDQRDKEAIKRTLAFQDAVEALRHPRSAWDDFRYAYGTIGVIALGLVSAAAILAGLAVLL